MNLVALLDYIIDVIRTLGISLFVVSIIAIVLDKSTNSSQLSSIITLLIISIVCAIFGGILSTLKKEE